MCASTPEKVEILDPPAGSIPGEHVVCVGYEGGLLQSTLFARDGVGFLKRVCCN